MITDIQQPVDDIFLCPLTTLLSVSQADVIYRYLAARSEDPYLYMIV